MHWPAYVLALNGRQAINNRQECFVYQPNCATQHTISRYSHQTSCCSEVGNPFNHFIIDGFVFSRWPVSMNSWWRHQMETFSALLALCAGNSSITGEFPSRMPVTRIFDIFFDLPLNKWLSKQPRRRWFELPSHSLWCRCNVISARSHWRMPKASCKDDNDALTWYMLLYRVRPHEIGTKPLQ